MKKYFAITALAFALVLATGSTGWAQAAVLGFDDHNGSPNSGTYSPGDSFTFTLNLHFIPGGTVLNVAGISYWLQQVGAASGGPFYFSITNRDATGSQFTVLQSPGNIFPQPMNSANAPFGSRPLYGPDWAPFRRDMGSGTEPSRVQSIQAVNA